MLKLPVNGTFKTGVLNGTGTIELTGTAVDPVAPFPPTVRSLGVASFAADPPSLQFGGQPFTATTSFSAGASSGIDVLHAGATSEAISAYIPDFTVPGESMAMRFFANASGGVKAGATVPAIPGLSFGASAGGHVAYWRLLTMPASTPAETAIRKLLADIRLPGQRGSVDAVPAPGEVVAFEYGGTLELKADFTWGYSLTGVESLQIGALQPSIAYDLRLKASAALGYSLAGEFVSFARAGSRPGWVRLTVQKKRDSKLAFATGFAVNAAAKAEFAQETVDDVLIAFFGADARRALRLFDEFHSFTDLDALEKRAGKVLFASLQKLSHTWIHAALDQTSLGRFVEFLGTVVEAYKKLDQKVLDLYEDFLKRSKLIELRSALEKITQLKRREDLTGLDDPDAWTVLRRLAEAELFSLAESNAAFQKAKELSAQALALLDGSALKDLIDRLEEDLRLDEIFGKLEQISSKEALLALSDRKLQGVVERILGGAFEDLRKSDAGAALKRLRTTLDGIKTFRDTMVAKLESALNRSVAMEINYAYTRTASDRALLDMEFDVSTPTGVELFDLAAAGKCDRVLSAANLAVVKVHDAALTHKVSRASHLQINFIGWKLGRLVEVVSELDVALEEHEGGLVQVFTDTESVKQRRENGREAKEMSQTMFMLSLSGELAHNPGDAAGAARLKYLIDTINRMSAGYESLRTDDRTDLKEMYEYLTLARWLELIPPSEGDPSPLPIVAAPGQVPSIDDFVSQFTSEIAGTPAISARYVVRYDDDTLREAFTAASGKALEDRIRASCRRIIAGYLISKRSPVLAAIGFAYAEDAARPQFKEGGAIAVGKGTYTVKLPQSLGKPLAGHQVVLDGAAAQLLATCMGVEEDISGRLVKLDRLVDEARATKARVSIKELSNAASALLKAGVAVEDRGGINAFFCVMDDLVQQGRKGKGRRESSLVLDIKTAQGKTVTKYLMAGGQA